MNPTRAVLALTLSALLMSCPSSSDKSALSGLKTYDVGPGGVHRSGLLTYEPAQYGVPPSGGPHNNLWMQCGIYDKPIAAEHAVHNLEHGAVWIVYRPDLPSSELEKLKSFVGGVEYSLLSPYPKTFNSQTVAPLPSPIVVSAWGVQKGYDWADDEIKTFLARYANGADNKAPERGSQCGGPYAVTVPDERAE